MGGQTGAQIGWQLQQLSWPVLRHQPWRSLSALLAVVLGVALAFAVHLINSAALGEFGAAVRSVNGQPDLVLRGPREGFDEALFARIAALLSVQLASPVVELDTLAQAPDGRRVPLKLLGLDAFAAGPLAPGLLPRPLPGSERLALLDPDRLFLNPAAEQQLTPGLAAPGPRLLLQQGLDMVPLQVGGRVSASGQALAVMDIAGAQARFGWLGRLSRIDLRLQPGTDVPALLAQWDKDQVLPPGVRAGTPDDSQAQLSNVSRAYRVNLTVLALVALFTGAFLVFSILSLSVARRLPQLALLGVLGLSARERLRLVLAESALLGLVGSALGLLLGTNLAWLALRLLGGDLGGGYFPGVAPSLQFSPLAALVYGGLGVVAALVGGWLPARMAQRLVPARALKGLDGWGEGAKPRGQAWLGPLLLVLGALLALAPPVAGLPLAAYGAVALLLVGGIVCVPAGVGLLLHWLPAPRQPLRLLAVQRARHQRHSATVAVAGVVASLALSVALTVMVASFREAVMSWLDTVLPADLYLRTGSGAGGGSGGSGQGDTVFLPPALLPAAATLPGVLRVEPQRVAQASLDPTRAPLVLIARPLANTARALPLVGELQPASLVAPGEVAAYVSEAVVSLYGAQPGSRLLLPLPNGQQQAVRVRGVWRDYARQSGAVMLDSRDFQRLTGDTRVNDLALWLAPGTDPAQVQAGLRRLAAEASGNPAAGALLEFASPGEIRAISLRIFDRSFAVTYWLQAVAIVIGLFGIAASFSAQVLARRKEFGLLAHLGLTRREVLALVAGEGALWTAAGALLGLLLGLAVSVVLVKVVNPQSFHWTMDLLLPWPRLALLCGAVLIAGTLTAWLAARRAVAGGSVAAVREDW